MTDWSAGVLLTTLVLTGAVLTTGCGGSGTMTLETLLERNAAARGGREAIRAVHAVDLELEITEPTFTVQGHYRATRDGWVRVDVFADGRRVFTEALGPDGAWQMGTTDGSVRAESAAGEAALRRGIADHLYGLAELPSLGYTLSLRGREHGGRDPAWVIERVSPDGFSETLFLDPRSTLVEREVETSALHPDVDSTKVRSEAVQLDYRESAGVLFPRRSEKRDLDSGKVLQTAVVTALTVNPAIDSSVFRRPVAGTSEERVTRAP